MWRSNSFVAVNNEALMHVGYYDDAFVIQEWLSTTKL